MKTSKRHIPMGRNRTLTKVVVNTLFFILGFTVIFVLLGAGAGTVSGFLNRHRTLIAIAGGVVIILLSVQVMGVLKLRWLNYEKKTSLTRRPRGVFGAFVIGITFAAAWTPCIGPILSSILILAATKETALKGGLLLILYSLGLGIPFLFSAFAFSYFVTFSDWMKRHLGTVKYVSGGLLLLLGLLLVLGQFHRFSAAFGFIPEITGLESNNISSLIAFTAGIISFISPCVLPLIPSYLTFITGVSVMEQSDHESVSRSKKNYNR
jgi:cytochrome c-type biogenesis protein